MFLRKINAGLSLLATVLLIGHAGIFSAWMLSGKNNKPAEFVAWVLVGLMAIHVVLTILLAIGNRKTGAGKEGKAYVKLNISTYVQRVTGVLMLLLTGFHIASAGNDFQPQMLHAVLHPLFFAAALVHTAVSASKALITLDVGNTTIIKIVDVAMKALCAAALVASVAGLYICLFAGAA